MADGGSGSGRGRGRGGGIRQNNQEPDNEVVVRNRVTQGRGLFSSRFRIGAQEEDVAPALGLLPAFPLPESIQVPSIEDTINVAEEHICVAGSIFSPSEFYLAVAPDSFDKLNQFIRNMTQRYREWLNGPKGMHWLKRLALERQPAVDTFLPPGSIVACFNPSQNVQEENEMVRAKIIRISARPNPGGSSRYHVFLMDFGEFAVVSVSQMFLLHQDYTGQPSWTIKCRFSLHSSYEEYHLGRANANWNPDTVTFMTHIMKELPRMGLLRVRFVRRVPVLNSISENELIWEVSVRIASPHPRRPNMMNEFKVIDQQIIWMDNGLEPFSNRNRDPDEFHHDQQRGW